MAAAAEQMKIREEGVRMVLRERLGKRRPLAGKTVMRELQLVNRFAPLGFSLHF